MNRNLAGLGFEHFPFQTHQISDIHLFECFVFVLSNTVPGYIRLNISFQILDVAERSLAHDAFGHHTTRYGYCFSLQLMEVIFHFLTVMGHIIFGDDKRIFSVFLQFCQFFSADLQKLVYVLRLWCLCILLFSHDVHSYLSFNL